VKSKPVLDKKYLPPAIVRLAEMIPKIAPNEVLPKATLEPIRSPRDKVEKIDKSS
jgi:hypothetical protein